MRKRNLKKSTKISDILLNIRLLNSSLSVISARAEDRGISGQDDKFLNVLADTLSTMEEDLLSLIENEQTGQRINIIIESGREDSIYKINKLYATFLHEWDCATRLWKVIAGLAREAITDPIVLTNRREEILLELSHAKRIVSSIDSLLQNYLEVFMEYSKPELLPRIMPLSGRRRSDSANAFMSLDIDKISDQELADFLLKADEAIERDISDRVLRRSGDDFLPVKLQKPRPVDKFFGYQSAKTFFKKYLQSFSEGRENAPLLITSLPGLGKTHFTISFTIAIPNLVLVLCEPQDLEKGLEKIIRELALRKNRRFVLFFDDVDTRKVNWYYFRTNVGGTFNLPNNILIVIASNYDFPANIASRGRCFSFPLFDEINCMEMVHDYLISLGMKNPSKELVSTIAADYVEEFGQRVFEELSPRTLVRYLDRFSEDTQKRIKLLNISKEKVVPVPEAALFYETNQKVIQRLNESI